MPTKRSSGYTLVEMMVGVAVLGIASAGISTILVRQNGFSSWIGKKSGQLGFLHQLQYDLLSQDRCTFALMGQPLPPVGTAEIEFESRSNAVYRRGWRESGVTLESFTIERGPRIRQSSSGDYYMSRLRIRTSMAGDAGQADKKNRDQTFQVVVQKEAGADRVLSCGYGTSEDPVICPTGKFLAGFAMDGAPICRPADLNVTLNCPPGKYLAGFNANYPICYPLPGQGVVDRNPTNRPQPPPPVRVDGGWGPWGACLNGSQTRVCNQPPPANGGADCSGAATRSCVAGGPSLDPMEYTVPGTYTYTVPAGITAQVRIVVVGAGASGNGGDKKDGKGGKAGNLMTETRTVQGPATYTVVVGQGGMMSRSGPDNGYYGNPGTESKFDGLTATGGVVVRNGTDTSQGGKDHCAVGNIAALGQDSPLGSGGGLSCVCHYACGNSGSAPNEIDNYAPVYDPERMHHYRGCVRDGFISEHRGDTMHGCPGTRPGAGGGGGSNGNRGGAGAHGYVGIFPI
ncbi:MAG: prepilin-type N-terminal cleavage/methylation domain-containing protein [Bacteriovoracia bacterium]